MRNMFRTLIYAFLLYCLGVCCLGCSAHKHHEEEVTAHHEHDAGSAEHSLQLNNGKRWVADAHTRSVFERMKDRFAGIELENQSGSELKRVSEDLKADVNALIAGCEMDGPAHDELHTFLMMYIPAVEDLAASGDVDDAEKIVRLLELYQKVFE